jgi:hypothetical protein
VVAIVETVDVVVPEAVEDVEPPEPTRRLERAPHPASASAKRQRGRETARE